MNNPTPVFSTKALDKLSSPEQLNQIMRISRSGTWLMAMGAALLVAALLIWCIFGRISTNISGTGILLQGRGTDQVIALGSGKLAALHVKTGDYIEKGQLIATIDQPAHQQNIDIQTTKLNSLRVKLEGLLKFDQSDDAVRKHLESRQKHSLEESIASKQKQLETLQRNYSDQDKLYLQGLFSRYQLQETQKEIDAIESDIRQLLVQVRSISVDSQTYQGGKRRELLAINLDIDETQRELDLLNEQMEKTNRVLSPYSGHVTEIKTRPGEFLTLGQAVIGVISESAKKRDLRAVLFVSLQDGKTLKEGMRAKVVPANVKREEFGMLHGIVTSIADFPSTREGMRSVLNNEMLVDALVAKVGTAPIAVEVSLIPDPDTPSGYVWTTLSGPPFSLQFGTPCEAMVAVKQQRPIERIIPMISKILGD